MKKIIILVVVAIVVVLSGIYYTSVSNNSNVESGEERIKIGVSLPLTGVAKSYGVEIKRAIELAVQSLRSEYSIAGIQFPYEFTFEDDRCDREIAREVGKGFIQARTKFIIGSACSGSTLGIADNSAIAQRKTFLISPSASSREISDLKNVFRTSISDGLNISSLSGVIASDGVSAIAIIRDEGDYARSYAEGMTEALQKAGISVVGEVVYARDGTDIESKSAEVSNLKGAEAVITIPQSDEDGIKVIVSVRANTDKPIYDVFALSSGAPAIERAGEAAEGVVFIGTKELSDLSAKFSELKDTYKARYNEEVIFDIYLGSAFDAVILLDNAIASVGSNPKNVIKFFKANRHENKGVLGEYVFDEYGDIDNVLLRPVTKVVRDGRVIDY